MEDFYDDECDYFDSTIAELKEQLKKEVKQEIQDRMTSLEKENAELQDVKENWKKVKRAYENKINELEREKNNFKHEFTYIKFSELLKDFTAEVWGIKNEYSKPKKCDRCDEDRYLTLVDSYGRTHKVKCKCNEYETKKIAVQKHLYVSEISRKYSGAKDLRMFIREYSEDSDCFSTSILKEDVLFLDKFDLEKIKEKNYEKIYFYTQEEAQKYADYLNSQENED